jgi:peptidoglycan/LPS O-acetylase OafA/YrhL
VSASLPVIDYRTPSADRPLPVRYMPQLDALRAFAVLAVWFEHWGKDGVPGLRRIDWGLMGVRLFFVLSGFLITGILLRARDAAAGSGGLWHAARNFYVRRFLRILPIYYLTLFVVTALVVKGLLPLGGMRGLFKWHVTYTTNVYGALYGYPWNAGMHFWSLAVEEQFYLLWPWLVLLVPRRHLLKTVWGAIGLALVYRIACAAAGRMGTIAMLPPGCIDQFALGAALAVIGHEPEHGRWWDRFARTCLWVGLPVMALTLGLSAMRRLEPVSFVLSGLAQGCVFAWLVARAAHGFGGAGRMILESRPLLYLGRISYGLYVYHPFVGAGVLALLFRTGRPMPGPWPLRFAVYGFCTILVATASWYLIERPIQGLKRHFKYTPAPETGQPRTTAELAPASSPLSPVLRGEG